MLLSLLSMPPQQVMYSLSNDNRTIIMVIVIRVTLKMIVITIMIVIMIVAMTVIIIMIEAVVGAMTIISDIHS